MPRSVPARRGVSELGAWSRVFARSAIGWADSGRNANSARIPVAPSGSGMWATGRLYWSDQIGAIVGNYYCSFVNSQLPTPNFQLPTANSQLPTPNSQRRTPNSQERQLPIPNSQLSNAQGVGIAAAMTHGSIRLDAAETVRSSRAFARVCLPDRARGAVSPHSGSGGRGTFVSVAEVRHVGRRKL